MSRWLALYCSDQVYLGALMLAWSLIGVLTGMLLLLPSP